MLKQAIPVLHVTSSEAARRFYVEGLGFDERFAYPRRDQPGDPTYQGFCRDGAWLHVSSFSGDAVAGGVAYVIVDDIDQFHAELVARGTPIAMPPTDQDWGNREVYVQDPDGNTIRFSQELTT